MDRERTRRSVVERRWKLLPPLREADGRGGCRALRDGRALRQGGPPPPRCSSRSAHGLTLAGPHARAVSRSRGVTPLSRFAFVLSTRASRLRPPDCRARRPPHGSEGRGRRALTCSVRCCLCHGRCLLNTC